MTLHRFSLFLSGSVRDPDNTIESHGGRSWARNFPRVCPFCGVMFYSWAPQPWPHDWTPETLEPVESLRMASGRRQTCGQAECILAAQDEHFEREQKERARLRALKLEREALDRAAAENDEKFAKERFR